jgi:ABC-type nitrate/sulfonate/bicarbonate transport system ATPase subunit
MLMQPALRPVPADEASVREAAPAVAIEFDDVSLAFRGEAESMLALDRVSLTAPQGQITTVVGPSGCGKTTLLRLVAGLLAPSSGRTLYNGREVAGLNVGVGFVTQDSNLFPWATTLANVEFPLAVRGVSARERRERAREWINMVGLAGFENSYPSQLSGGMQKRVSIARTFIYEPDVILLDEPFGALDAQTRMMLHHQLLQLWHKRRMTMLFITHDLVEAITLSDEVVVMSKRPGRVKECYRVPLPRPRNVFEIYLEPGFDDAYGALWKHFKAELATDKIRPVPPDAIQP